MTPAAALLLIPDIEETSASGAFVDAPYAYYFADRFPGAQYVYRGALA